ncbi:MAG: hypothetical protein IJL56_03930 [Bacteroidales bacterium]|nr:hypothetical protein [Bacteroidales bacterium]
MTLNDYIRKNLCRFLDKFKTARVVLDCDYRAHVHTVDILPHELLERNDVFEWIDTFIMDSIEKYPKELVCIKSPDSIIPYGGQGFILDGLEYKPISLVDTQKPIISGFTSKITESVTAISSVTLVDNTKRIPSPIKEEVVSSHFTDNLLAA